jgi:hypothetical protein
MREFEGAFPGRRVKLVRSYMRYSWPSATIDVGEMRIFVSTHMGDYSGSVEDRPGDGASSLSTGDYLALKTECGRQTFASAREVATWFADWVRSHAIRAGKYSGSEGAAG